LGSEAFIWDTVNGMRNLRKVLAYDYGLNLAGWILQEARGISADGRTLIGWGLNPSGWGEAWIAKLGSGPPCTTFVAPDLDHDCDVDADDVSAMAACSSRAKVPATPACAPADLDDDGDVDPDDFAIAQRCYSGAGVIPNPNCAN
jgi:hypothetical protein